MSPKHLTELPVDISPLGPAYRGILESIKRVSEGVENAAWFAVIGYYGSGKTLLLRRIAHESMKKFGNVVPIYFYLGIKDEILLFDSLGKYISDVESVVRGVYKFKPKVHGDTEDWVKTRRLEALKQAYESVRQAYEPRKKEDENVKYFFEAMRRLNELGYTPLVFFDEFERVVYTGEGVVGSDQAVRNLYVLSEQFLELTRGHLFGGVGVIALTDDMRSLLEKAMKENRPHVSQIQNVAGIRYEQLKFASPNIVYSGVYRLNWTHDSLEVLSKILQITLPVDFIRILAQVLPTPRGLLTIAKKAYEMNLTQPGKKDLYKLYKDRVESFINALRAERTSDNRPIIYPTSAWDERFKKLLEEGFYVVGRNELSSVGQLFAKPEEAGKLTEDSARGIGRNIMNTLVDYGLYEKSGKEYVLRRELMAFFLEIERLPSGQTATMRDVIEIVKRSIEERRKRTREYAKQRKTTGEKSGQA